MIRAAPLALMALALTAPAGAQPCRLCYSDPAARPGEVPLRIEIWTDLNFSRMALIGRDGGSAELPATGAGKRTSGAIVDLGGLAVAGRGKITGAPGREVRIALPEQIEMTSVDGSHAELVAFTTDLPPHPVLSASGELEFGFGARLILRSGNGGNLRGRIPISVDYN